MILSPRAPLDPTGVYCLLQALANRCFSDGGLAVGGTNTQIKTAAAINFAIAGRVYAKAAEDNVAVTLTNTGATDYCKVRVEVNAAGTLSFVQGPMATAQVLAVMPPRSASKATVGWIEIPNSFTFATTGFDAAGVTFVDGDPDLSDGVSLPNHIRGISSEVVTGH